MKQEIYIVCEDSGSGRNFWEHINKVVLKNRAIILPDKNQNTKDKTGGISKVFSYIKNSGVKKGDIVILVADKGDAGWINQKNDISEYAEEIRFLFFYTSYACIEEIFITFERLLNWLQLNHSKELIDIYTIVRDNMNTPNWTSIVKQNNVVSRLKDLYLSANIKFGKMNTKARVCSHLLKLLTAKAYNNGRVAICPDFTVNKSRIGDCWTSDCNKTNGICTKSNCVLIKDKLDSLDKLKILNDESVLKSKTIDIFTLKNYIH